MNTKDENFIDEFIERESLKGLSVKNLRKKRSHVERFLIFFGKACSKTTKEDVNLFLEEKRGVYSTSTYNYLSTILHKFFVFLVEERAILVNPVIIEREKEERASHHGVFTVEEVHRILDVIPDTKMGIRDRAIIEMFYSTGMRLRELIELNVDDIDFVEREVYIRNGKNMSERIVPIGERALLALENYLDIRYTFFGLGSERDALFLSFKGNRISEDAIRHQIHHWKKKAGVTSKGSVHAFRHSCATHLLQNGAPINLVKRLLGHAFLRTTQQYTHITNIDVRKKIEEINREVE